MTQVNVLEARNNLSRLIDAAAAGEDVVIAKRGKPVVRIIKYNDGPARGTGARIAKWLDENPLTPELARPADEIARDIQRERDAWD